LGEIKHPMTISGRIDFGAMPKHNLQVPPVN